MFFRNILLTGMVAFLLVPAAKAQTPSDGDTVRKIWQLSGLVVNENNSDPISFAIVRIYHTRRGIHANQEGFYSLPVSEDDTLVFSALGYKTNFLVVKDYLNNYKGDKSGNYLYAIHYMPEDTIVLPTVYIFPYSTPEALRVAMIEANGTIPEEITNAQKSLDPATMDKLVESITVDDGERVMTGRQLYYNQYMTRNVVQTANFIDPITIYRFLRYLNEKSKEKKVKDLNYWEESGN